MPRKQIINRSHWRKLTFDMGQLVPGMLMEVLPGEVVQHRVNSLLRVSPMAAPVMHGITFREHTFFVPMRIVWPQAIGGTEGDNWQDFITGGPDGRNAARPPTIDSTGAKNDLLDYLGVPPKAGIKLNALAVYAYNAIYNYWYRDQDLGAVREANDTSIARISWRKDYFTASRPFLQKGPDVTVPITGYAPITGLGKTGNQTFNKANQTVYETGGGTRQYANAQGIGATDPNEAWRVEEDPNNPGFPLLLANLAAATGANINDVRAAFSIQRYQENMARYGSRYAEYVKRSFGVRPQDSRLQEPELVGASRARVNISEVLQTSPDGNDPRFGVGDLYGHGISAMRGGMYRRRIPEHGFLITLLSVRPQSVYMDGMDRHWLKTDKMDYYQPELRAIGQQAVYDSEVFATSENQSGDPPQESVFSYQDRYSEYRHQRSSVHGEFRDVLKYWHLGREFESKPVLNQSFTDCNPSKRIFKEQTMHSLWCAVSHRMRVLSPIGRNPTPRIL